jgi:hypothetical protein
MGYLVKGLICSCSLLAVSATAFGQTETERRVIEETLVLKDPTVAASSRWIMGASAEALYLNAPFTSFSSSNDGTIEKGRVKATAPGGNVFAGYGDLTVAFTYRKANGKSTLTHEPSALVPQNYTHEVQAAPNEKEFLVRWLARGLSGRWLTPYAYAGYVELSSDFADVRVDGSLWPNGTSSLASKVKSKSTIAGIGGIIPVTETFGFRGDVGITHSRQTTNYQGRPDQIGTGTGSRWTGMMYYNFAEGWNGQLGGRYEYFNGGGAGTTTVAGVFVMLGYTFK